MHAHSPLITLAKGSPDKFFWFLRYHQCRHYRCALHVEKGASMHPSTRLATTSWEAGTKVHFFKCLQIPLPRYLVKQLTVVMLERFHLPPYVVKQLTICCHCRSNRIPLHPPSKAGHRQARGASNLIRMSTLKVKDVAAAPQPTKPASTGEESLLLKFLAAIGVLVQKNPARFRSNFIPFLPVDLVVVDNPVQIEQTIRSPDLGRSYELPENEIPRWLRLFLESSRFVCKVDKSKFVHLISVSPDYEARLATIKSALAAQPHSQSDVDEVSTAVQELCRRAALLVLLALHFVVPLGGDCNL